MSLFRLHKSLWRHRKVMLLGLLALFVVLGLFLSRISIDTRSSTALFPDETGRMQEIARGLDMIPFSHLLVVQLSDEGELGTAELARAADALLTAIPDTLAVKLEDGRNFEPVWLLRLLPGLADTGTLEEWEQTTHPVEVRRRLSRMRDMLALGASGPVVRWLVEDPLGWRDFILPHLPLSGGFPVADPRYGYPTSEDGRHLLLILNPSMPLFEADGAIALMDAVEQAVQELPPGIEARVAGGHRHSAENTRAVDEDIERTVLFSLVGLAVIYLLFIRSLGAVWIYLTPLAAVMAGMAAVAVGFPAVSGLAIGFAASILGVSEDYAIHMHFALRSGRARSRIAAAMFTPITRGMLLNVAGFGVLLLSAVPALRQMAYFAIVALVVGWALAVFVLPVCPGFDRPKRAAGPNVGEPSASPRLLPTTVVLGLLLLVCGHLSTSFQIDTNFREMGSNSRAIESDMRAIVDVWGRNSEQLVIVYGEDRQSALANAAEIKARLAELFPERRFSTLTDLIPSNSAENASAFRSVLAERKEALARSIGEEARRLGFSKSAFADFFESVELLASADAATLDSLGETGFGELAKLFVRESDQDVRVLVLVDAPVDESLLDEEFWKKAIVLSPEQVSSVVNEAFSSEKRIFLFISIAFIVVLFLLYRRPANVFYVLVPPCCALLAIMVWHVFTGTALNLAGFAALPLVIGLSIDHGIIVGHEAEHARNYDGARAVVISSLTSLVSIGSLALATHPALHAIGLVIFLGILGELPAVLFLLPRLVSPRKSSRGQGSRERGNMSWDGKS